MPTFSQATEDLIAKAATRAIMSDVEAGRDLFLAEPWKFDHLFRGKIPSDWKDAAETLETYLDVGKSALRSGHWSADFNRVMSLQQAVAAARDPRFPAIWAQHIRDIKN